MEACPHSDNSYSNLAWTCLQNGHHPTTTQSFVEETTYAVESAAGGTKENKTSKWKSSRMGACRSRNLYSSGNYSSVERSNRSSRHQLRDNTSKEHSGCQNRQHTHL
ncbi:hypothetical protein Y032_0052g2271 [Ancylostoma ceylanicum]|uniref:Uncharacterized protein n=1 Tax=Ancylostoma ceylanicum TaxID=53326 RepID=A0A016U8K0_9BILA|nr:hypothetical protein Y032_0052g2271 [Ancylostoma ceylanicum]